MAFPARTDRAAAKDSNADPDSRRRLYLWLVAGVILAGTIVRIVLFFSTTPQTDESWTHFYFSTTSLWDAASRYDTPNNHIFYSILARLAQIAIGGDILVTRLPALLAGIAVTPAMIVFALRASASRRISLLAGTLAAFSPQLVFYSAEGRGYSVLALLTLVWLILGHRIITVDRSRVWVWVALAVVSAVGNWTIPVFVYAVFALTVWVIVSRGVRFGITTDFVKRGVFTGLLAVGLTALAYYPAVHRMGLRSIIDNPLLNATNPALGGVPDRAISSFLELLPAYLGSVTLWLGNGVPTIAYVLLAIMILCGVASRRIPTELRLLAPVTLVAYIVALGLARLQPLPRSWTPILPLLLVTAAAGFGALSFTRRLGPTRAVVGTTVLALLAMTWGLTTAATYHDSPLRAVPGADLEEVVKLMIDRYPEGATLTVGREAWPQAIYWFSEYPEVVIGGETRLVLMDHRLGDTFSDVSRMRHFVSAVETEPAHRVGVTPDNMVAIAEFPSSTLYLKS